MKILTTADRVLLGEYKDLARARLVMEQLQLHGVKPTEISLISSGDLYPDESFDMRAGNYVSHASATETGVESGAVVGGVGGGILGLMSLVTPGLGPIVVAGSVIMGVIAGMSAGALAGGMIGVLMELGYSEEQAVSMERGIAAGHVLVLVEDATVSAENIHAVLVEHRPVATITKRSH